MLWKSQREFHVCIEAPEAFYQFNPFSFLILESGWMAAFCASPSIITIIIKLFENQSLKMCTAVNQKFI